MDPSHTCLPSGKHINPEISAGFTLHFVDYYYIPQCVHYIKLYVCVMSVCARINIKQMRALVNEHSMSWK